MNDKLILRNRLKETRREQKLSQAQLADLVGVSRNTISSIETGVFQPTAKLALTLCIALVKKFEDLNFILRNEKAPAGRFKENNGRCRSRERGRFFYTG